MFKRQSNTAVRRAIGLFCFLMALGANTLAAQANSLAKAPPKGFGHLNSPAALLQEANEAYRSNELEKALRGYLFLADSGYKNGYLAFNIGNAYFRLGQLGPALLWYERAQKYLPRFEDLQVNFRYARNQIVDEEFKPPEPTGTVALFRALHRYFNLRETLYLTLGLFWLLVLCLAAYIWFDHERVKARLRLASWLIGPLFAVLLLSAGLKIYRYEKVTEAIVMRSAVEVKTAPSDEFSTAFTLHEGTKVILEEQDNGWARIALPGNPSFIGWMPRESLTVI